jgi:hypothetical protein
MGTHQEQGGRHGNTSGTGRRTVPHQGRGVEQGPHQGGRENRGLTCKEGEQGQHQEQGGGHEPHQGRGGEQWPHQGGRRTGAISGMRIRTGATSGTGVGRKVYNTSKWLVGQGLW